MTTRVEEILIRVRDSLADEDKSRWSDDRLLRLVDEAQKKIATKAQLLRRVTTISILANINEYQLPSDAYLLTRVVDSEGKKYPIKSHSAMDYVVDGMAWELDTGSQVEFIIHDNQQPGWLKVYPIVTDPSDGEVFITDDYGITVDIEDDLISSPYGVVVDISTNALNTNQFSSVYGVVVGMAELQDILRVYYRAKPQTIANLIDELEIDDKWDAAIKHYVVGMALHDDQDTQNRAVSSDEMAMYGVEFNDAKDVSSKDHTNRSVSETNYNPGI